MSTYETGRTRNGSPTSSKAISRAPVQPVLIRKKTSTTPAAPAAAPVPNGGLTDWLQVAGAFFLFVNTRAFLLLLIGVLTGPLFDLGYFYILNVLGSFLVVFGVMMTSIAERYYQIILPQGVCVGLGCGCLFVPSVAIVGTYFSTKRSLAMGIAASRSSLSAVIYPIVFRRLEPTIGFGWATRVVGFLALATLLFSIATMRTRLPPKPKGRSILAISAFKEAPFSLFTLGEFLGFMGLYIPYYYISSYATRMGPLNMLVPFSTVSAILAFAWIGIRDTPGIFVFALLYGFFSGAFVSLPPATIASLTPDMEQLGARMGTSFVFAGLGVLVGNPIAGSIVDIEKPDFLPPQIFCGVLVAVTALAMAAARLSSSGLELKHKV
ncbi:MFS general substrate transporter [Violaceomyces palustris]|uniref:MFS general substrate transporter n=1 Tax=Violaceomyces palustris TaxID=1673888 RepID=A0ACD0NQQ7_9BASI|nr:MFS general substrate transporter [Violaceomyces palustris]